MMILHTQKLNVTPATVNFSHTDLSYTIAMADSETTETKPDRDKAKQNDEASILVHNMC